MAKKRKKITEEMNLHEEWFKEAKKQKTDTVEKFIRHLFEDYSHDYGTAVHAVSAAALAGAWAGCEKVGLTGFQAGCVMWDFIQQWMFKGNECGLKIINYDDFLYPQYKDKFEKTISTQTWKNLQEKAKAELEEAEKKDNACEAVRAHWRNIAAGNVPFGYTVKDDD